MDETITQEDKVKQGAEDSGRYFKYMAEFVGLTEDDAKIIRKTHSIIEKHLPEIVAKFYGHLLRYPPTRKFFLKKDGSIDQPYVELRMRHLTNFWLRTAQAAFDEDYARYIDYVGRAHTSHGADPHIYIAERYVIGQVGFMQHAIDEALTKELRHVDEDLELRAIEAWDRILMVILEMLSRAYGVEREQETFDSLLTIDENSVDALAREAFDQEQGSTTPTPKKKVKVACASDIAEGERKILDVEGVSVGLFHHNGNWYAIRNLCLHRGGPVATGKLDGDTLVCPWHGFRYNLTTGQMLSDPKAKLDYFPVSVQEDDLYLDMPDVQVQAPSEPAKENEFAVTALPPGQARFARVDGEPVAVFNVGGKFFATQDTCTHQGGQLSEGTLDGQGIICPIHGSCFDVTTGEVLNGPAIKPLKTFKVTIEGECVRVEKNS